MPTYTLIASNTLSSSAASVTFSSIPQTYTDLVIKTSTRTNYSGSTPVNIYIYFNNNSQSVYSYTWLTGSGSVASSSITSNDTQLTIAAFSQGPTYTTNTFSNTETYIPNYTTSDRKVASDFSITENNATASRMYVSANLWRLPYPIDTIDLVPVSGSFVSGSSFFLYGIKSS